MELESSIILMYYIIWCPLYKFIVIILLKCKTLPIAVVTCRPFCYLSERELKDPYRIYSFFFKRNVEPRYQKTFRGNFEPPLQSKCPQNWCMQVKGQDIPPSTFNVACITLLLPRGNNVVHLNKRLHRSWTKVYL